MTTVTEQAVEVIEKATANIEEAVEVIAEVANASWKGNIVTHKISSRAEAIAAALEPLVVVNDKGLVASRKSYYQVAKAQGLDPQLIKDVEEFNADYAHGVHAVSSDKALSRFRDDVEAENFSVRADIGENSRYQDNYRRHHEYSVSGGPDKDRVMKADYAYHNPSVKTTYKGINESRQAVHNLARDLLG